MKYHKYSFAYIIFYAIVLMLTCSSCAHILATVLIKNPKTRSIASQEQYSQKKGFTTYNNHYLALPAGNYLDTTLSQQFLVMAYIFNQDGYRLKYTLENFCGATIESAVLNNNFDHIIIDSTEPKFSYYAQYLRDKNWQPIDTHIISQKPYTIIKSWNRYMAPKLWFRDQIQWIADSIQYNQLTHVQVVTINSDFLVENGFKKNSKAKLSKKIKDRKLDITFKKLPKIIDSLPYTSLQ